MAKAHTLLASLAFSLLAVRATATTQELIDFTQNPTVSTNLRSGSLTIEDYPLPVVDNAGQSTYDHSLSTVFERAVTGSSNGRPGFLEATLTYSVANTFSFPLVGHEISLWLHVDGPPIIIPGGTPFTTNEPVPEMVTIQLTGQGKTFTSNRMRVARGWNELKFYLSCDTPTARQGTSRNNRITHFTPNDPSGTTINQIKIIVSGTNEMAESHTVGKIRLNTCKLQPIEPCTVVMVYDDAWSGFFAYGYALGLLRTYEMPATVAVVKNYASQTTAYHMTLAQIQTVFGYTTGSNEHLFDMVNHTQTHAMLHGDGQGNPHRNYRTVGSAVGVYDDIFEGRKYLIDNNLVRNGSEQFLIYPGGASDAQVYAAMRQIGIKYGRIVNCERDHNENVNATRNPFAGQCYDMAAAQNSWGVYVSGNPLGEFQDWLDEGIVTGRPRFVMWHDLLANMPTFDQNGNATDGWHTVFNSNTKAWHDSVIGHIQTLRGTTCMVKTLANWYESLTDLQKVAGVHY